MTSLFHAGRRCRGVVEVVKASPLIARKHIVLWGALCAVGMVVGDAFGGIAFAYYGGIGIAAATCLLVGLYVVSSVRRGLLPKGSGISILLYSSAISAIVPPIVLLGCLIALFSGGAIGMASGFIILQAIWNLGIGILSFVTFSIVILCIHPR